ncbi:alkaline phosphatase family protein [Variovorax sp. UMC13]|uniref:alkaline phosphatase family protein n=1 Tax=Variovorax sp. UMC13 TaxID=1862326 RepID=UPI0016029238|nr:alkaline phosphatase family protein [Variovorax sp. UMC13]
MSVASTRTLTFPRATVGRGHRPAWPSFARWRTLALAATLGAVLSACGGGSGGSGNGSPTPTPPTDPAQPELPGAPTVRRTLLIDIDGATYAAVQAGIANGSLPHLAKLEPRLAYSGGRVGTPSQQPTLDTPGWATLLTGAWASRHQVLSQAPKQVMRGPTLYQRLKQNDGTRQHGAAVASQGLAQLLASEHDSGNLDTLGDCSKDAMATDCVTTQAAQMIGGSYATVLAQYRAAKDAALDFGQNAPQYAGTLARLDQAVGTLVAETAKRGGERWLIVVTGNHGLSANSQDDGLPLLPESATFIGLNQPANMGADGVGAPLPQTLAELYAHASIADVTPTLLGYLDALPDTRRYVMDGARLLGAQPVSQLDATVLDNNSADVRVALGWAAPAKGAITVLRGGEVIASQLPAGTTSYVDTQLSQVLVAKGTYQLDYTVQAGDGAEAATRAVLTPSVSYVPPVPLAPTLRNGLVSYYPFSATLPPVDAMAHSTMGPASSELPAGAGLVVPGPLAGTQGLLVDTNFVTASGLEGYRLTPAEGFDISKGSAPQFTLGFWFKTPACVDRNNVTILSNKSYVSGGNAGVAVGLFASSGNQCGVAFNIGSGGGVRADGPTGPYTQITVNRWVYIAFSVDGVAKTMNMVVFDPVTGTTNRVATGKSTGSVDLSKLSPYPQWGIGDDGTGTFLMNKCNGTVTPPYFAGKCATAPTYQQHFGDLAMWNRVLSDAELQSIFLSNKPLSTLPATPAP